MELDRTYDVLVVGGGNAALCAAITARQRGASVLLLERAPREFRGGNSRHTRNLRCMHESPTEVLTGAYPEAEYWDDLVKVTGGETNEKLARIAIRESAACAAWMRARAVRFQPSLGGTLHLSRTNAFFLGGGRALLNAYYRVADALGIDVEYSADVRELDVRDPRGVSAVVVRKGFGLQVRARTVVAAAGGFQANIAWLKEAWGSVAENFIVRGTPYDTGEVLRMLMRQGMQTVGDPKQCHAVAIDARAPRFDAGIVTRVDCVSLGIVVNACADRFYDEGEDFWPKRYAIWGRLVAQQPGQIAYSIIDAKMIGRFMPPVFAPVEAPSVRELATALKLDPDALEHTVDRFNAAVQPGAFDHTRLDDCRTRELAPAKTHWARRIDTPPFFAYPLRPGITFTYLGLAVNEHAQVVMQDGRPAPNVYAAGEIMAGNILGKGYLAGIGMTIGTVFGRIAGEEAARHALS